MMATINQLKRRRLGFSEVCLLVCCADLKRKENIKGSYQSLSATPFGGAGEYMLAGRENSGYADIWCCLFIFIDRYLLIV
jgi:hypothetical protein